MAQTPDGYLWIGTWKGLYRFDGTEFERIAGTGVGTNPIAGVLGLAVDAQGQLLVRTQAPELLRFRNGKFENLLRNVVNARGVTAMFVRASGAIVIATIAKGTFEFVQGRLSQLQSDQIGVILSIAETRDGRLWLGTRENGLFSVAEGHAQESSAQLPDKKVNCMLARSNGQLWVGTDKGLALWDGTHIVVSGSPAALHKTQVFTLLEDKEANLWVATDRGVLRLNANGVLTMPGVAMESGTAAGAFIEDREHDLWIGDADSLKRFRKGVFTTFPINSISSASQSNSIFVGATGRVWLAPASGGLDRLEGNELRRMVVPGLAGDVVYAMDGYEDLWLGRQRGGLTRLRMGGNGLSAKTFTQRNGLAQNNIYAVRQTTDGALWVGTLTGGVSRLQNDTAVTFTTNDGLAANSVAAIEEGRDHTMWFGTSNGLSALHAGRWNSYHAQDGLPSAEITCLTLDQDGVLWIGTELGVAAIFQGSVIAPSAEAPLLHEPIRGIAEGLDHRVWLTTARHVLSIERQAFLSGKWAATDLRQYDQGDGLLSTEGVRRSRSVMRDTRGFLWFSLNHAIAVVDPARSADPVLPSITHVTSVLVGNDTWSAAETLRISAAHRRLTFKYTGISLATPERVRYRFRLRGFDERWSASATLREATFTNLEAGSYIFQVQSSNTENSWNGSVVDLPVQIEPRAWQTWQFRLAGGIAGLLCTVALYRMRTRYLLQQADARFEAQLSERIRIARELHDTLLQGLDSASLQLGAAASKVPEHLPAKALLNHVLRTMEYVSGEARDSLRGLRSTPADDSGLEQRFLSKPVEVAAVPEIEYHVRVEGSPIAVQPVVVEEVFNIGREAILNACRHARATRIEIQIKYYSDQLSVRVFDDGSGIDPNVLRSGRSGHWGLLGMRERAKRVGGSLSFTTGPNAGTQVVLSVPARIAYRTNPRNRLFGMFAP